MSRKNFLGRALRSGLLATAAATMLMGNMAAFAAEDDELSSFFWQENVISGTVTEVGADSITIQAMGAMEEGGFGMGMPEDGMQPGQMGGGFGMGMPQDGETPPELPDGETPPEPPEGQTPPELADGERPEPPEGQTPPEFTDGERPEPPEGELPEGMGSMMGQPQDGGRPEGGFGMGMPGMGGSFSSEVTVNINSDTAIIKADGESGSISDISAGSNVMVMYDGSTALSILIAD